MFKIALKSKQLALFGATALAVFLQTSGYDLHPNAAVFSSSQAQRNPSAASGWPLADAQHPAFLKWANERNENVKNRSEALDFKDDKSLSPEEAYLKFNVPTSTDLSGIKVEKPDPKSISDIRKTAQLYFNHFGKNTTSSLLWSGVETGNTLTKDMDYRWNSLREAGLYDPKIRAKFIQQIKKTGIKNLRFGFSNHEMVKNPDGTWSPRGWKEADEMIHALTDAGIDLSLDLHHFGIETRFMLEPKEGQKARSNTRVFCVDSKWRPATYRKGNDELCDKTKYDPTKSFYLHPEWPDHFADFALEAFRRYHTRVKAFTFINEPETVKGFNSGLWHGAFPGWLTPPHPTAGYYEAERAINIGIAAVKARLKIENFIAKNKISPQNRPIYFHTEAMVPKANWPDFNNYVRYITSDTILGADWVMNYNFKKLQQASLDEVSTSLQWEKAPEDKRTVLHLLTTQTIWWGFDGDQKAQNQRKTHFFQKLDQLQTLHRALARFGQTMRSYTVLGVDYYSHNEEGLEPKPEFYVHQIREGKRIGLFQTAKAYFERYKMAMMITETGTPYFVHGARWHQQILFECAKLANSGVPFLGYTMYPAIDTYGWEHAISRPKEPLYDPKGSLYNPSGILFLHTQPPPHVDAPGFKALQPKPFVFELVRQLKTVLKD